MSTGPGSRTIDVEMPGQNGMPNVRSITLLPNAASELALRRLRARLAERRRQQRRELMQDFAQYGSNLPAEAKAAFAREIVTSSKEDVNIPAMEVMQFMESLDPDAMAIVLWSCSPEIVSFEDAKEVIQAYGDIVTLFTLIQDLMTEHDAALGNLSRPEEMASLS